MRIAFFGSSRVSACWNGAATYYRGPPRALAVRGHAITFCEPDAHGRQALEVEAALGLRAAREGA